jgi:hypothetical protein
VETDEVDPLNGAGLCFGFVLSRGVVTAIDWLPRDGFFVFFRVFPPGVLKQFPIASGWLMR